MNVTALLTANNISGKLTNQLRSGTNFEATPSRNITLDELNYKVFKIMSLSIVCQPNGT